MAGDASEKYQLGRLILEYLRTFTWPVVILVFVLVYWEDVRNIIERRHINVFGLEIGPAVERIEQVKVTTQQELQDIRALVETLNERYERELALATEKLEGEGEAAPAPVSPVSESTAELARDIETKIASLGKNLGREVQDIREQYTRQQMPVQQMPAVQGPPATRAPDRRAVEVARLERNGFEAILARDLEAALNSFERASELWPDYHNVSEIRDLLRRVAGFEKPPDESIWAGIDNRILTQFSWGMPEDIRQRFRAAVTKKS